LSRFAGSLEGIFCGGPSPPLIPQVVRFPGAALLRRRRSLPVSTWGLSFPDGLVQNRARPPCRRNRPRGGKILFFSLKILPPVTVSLLAFPLKKSASVSILRGVFIFEFLGFSYCVLGKFCLLSLLPLFIESRQLVSLTSLLFFRRVSIPTSPGSVLRSQRKHSDLCHRALPPSPTTLKVFPAHPALGVGKRVLFISLVAPLKAAFTARHPLIST